MTIHSHSTSCIPMSSNEAKHKSREIDKKLKKEKADKNLKLLLLGASDSGKSTLFKQMRIIQDDHGGLTKAELEENRQLIMENILTQINILLQEIHIDKRSSINSTSSSSSFLNPQQPQQQQPINITATTIDPMVIPSNTSLYTTSTTTTTSNNSNNSNNNINLNNFNYLSSASSSPSSSLELGNHVNVINNGIMNTIVIDNNGNHLGSNFNLFNSRGESCNNDDNNNNSIIPPTSYPSLYSFDGIKGCSGQEVMSFQDPFNLERAMRVVQACTLLEGKRLLSSSWPSIIQDIKALWNSYEVQHQFNIRENGTKYFHLNDSAPYFLNNLDQYSNEQFTPTEQDVLRIRTKTTGVTEADYLYRGLRFKMVDVGGQKCYRRKWIHCFDNVSAVLFVASLNSYDQLLEEDHVTNRLQDSITLFRETANSVWFTNSTLILFLNKSDLFREKIKRIPLTKYFPEYTGPQKAKDAATFIYNLFHAQLIQKRQIYFHITCAINTKDIKFVFQSVVDDLLKKSLEMF